MLNHDGQAERLQQVIYDSIALGKAMQLQVRQLTPNDISIEAPVAEANINIHGTAFAGSIYSICALTAWGFLYNRLLLEELAAEVVLAEAQIRYLAPVRQCIRSQCSVDETIYQEFQQELQARGKARLDASVLVQEDDRLQASMEGRLSARLSSNQFVPR